MKRVYLHRVLSTEDLKRLMAEAADRGLSALKLHGAHFSEINLRMEEVPVSLDLDDAVIDGDFNLTAAKFHGSYISLDRAEIGGFISLNGMKVVGRGSDLMPEGIGLFLRGALIHGTVHLQHTKINTLCVYAADFARGKGDVLFADVTGLFRLEGTVINRIFLHPHEGDLEEFQRREREAQN